MTIPTNQITYHINNILKKKANLQTQKCEWCKYGESVG